MQLEIYGGALRHWAIPCCLFLKRVVNIQCRETYWTISFEILHWYLALTITTNHAK